MATYRLDIEGISHPDGAALDNSETFNAKDDRAAKQYARLRAGRIDWSEERSVDRVALLRVEGESDALVGTLDLHSREWEAA